jgi:hypothetical protein
MVASLPVTPLPAVAGPLTGGQKLAHPPLQFDLVGVSGTNQYSVKPLALVRTVVPPIVAVRKAVPDEFAVADAAGLAEPPELLEPPVDELPHAAGTAQADPARASDALNAPPIAVMPAFRCLYPALPSGRPVDRATVAPGGRPGRAGSVAESRLDFSSSSLTWSGAGR